MACRLNPKLVSYIASSMASIDLADLKVDMKYNRSRSLIRSRGLTFVEESNPLKVPQKTDGRQDIVAIRKRHPATCRSLSIDCCSKILVSINSEDVPGQDLRSLALGPCFNIVKKQTLVFFRPKTWAEARLLLRSQFSTSENNQEDIWTGNLLLVLQTP